MGDTEREEQMYEADYISRYYYMTESLDQEDLIDGVNYDEKTFTV